MGQCSVPGFYKRVTGSAFLFIDRCLAGDLTERSVQGAHTSHRIAGSLLASVANLVVDLSPSSVAFFENQQRVTVKATLGGKHFS